MKIVRIQGGLGNQMFQYALAFKLKQLNPDERVMMDLTQFKGYTWHPYELKNVFDVDFPVASFSEIAKFTIPFSGYTRMGRLANFIFEKLPLKREPVVVEKGQFEFEESILTKDGNVYYDGYWCNQGYFADIRSTLLDVFSFKPTLSKKNDDLKQNVLYGNSVSVHVRRGNYLLFDEYKDICERPYYEKAIQYIKEHVDNPHFYVFSNDIQWCKDNLHDLMDKCTFVENSDSKTNYVDMQLMSCCKHNIIAHSTFSWWAAWLNTNSNKIVVAPYVWNNNYKAVGPQLEDWVLISNKD